MLEQIPKIKGGLKLVKEEGATRFLYCPRNENDIPELLVGKKIEPADIKRLRNSAKQKKFVRGTVVLNEERIVVFRAKNSGMKIFQKDVRQVFGKKISRLKTALFEDVGADNVEEAIEEALEGFTPEENAPETQKTTVEAKDAVKELRKVRTELDSALKDMFQKTAAPASLLAPLASAFAALAGPCEEASKALKNAPESPEALQAVRARIDDHARLHQALLTLHRQHAAEAAVWLKEGQRLIEDFVGGTVKADWDLSLLTQTMEQVRGPLDEARSLAFQGRYADAAARFKDAWQIYAAGKKLAEASGNAKQKFEDMASVKEARAGLAKLKEIKREDFIAGIRDELKGDKTLTKEEKKALAERAYRNLQEQILGREERLEAMRESLMRAANKGLSEQEIEDGYGSVIDEELREDFGPELQKLVTDAKDAVDGGDASQITKLEQYRAQQIAEVENRHFKPWQTAIDQLREGNDSFEERYARLDGLGSGALAGFRERVAALRKTNTTLMGHTGIAASRKSSLKHFGRAINQKDIDLARDEALEGHQKKTQPWIEEVAQFRQDADTLVQELEQELQKQEEALRQARTEAQTLLKALEERVSQYKEYKEIPSAYTAKRDERLKGLKLYVDSSNIQTIQQATETMRRLLPGGKGAEFPSVPEAIAMFMATMDRQQSWYNINDDQRKAAAVLVENMKPFDFKAIQDRIEKLKSGDGKDAAALGTALTTRATALQKKLEADGLFAPGIDGEIQALDTELKAAETECQKLVAAFKTLAELQTRADKLLGEYQGKWFGRSADFTGRLKTETDDIRTEAGGVGTAALVALVRERAEKLAQEIRTEWENIEKNGGGEKALVRTLGEQQANAEKAEKERKEQEAAREKAWEEKLELYKQARKAAEKAGIKDDQLGPMDSLRDMAKKSHADKKTLEVHEQAMKDLGMAIDRLGKLADNPEIFEKTARKELATLPKKWADSVGRYRAGVQELLKQLEGLQVSDEQQPTVKKAIQTVESALDLFSADAFSEPILTITYTQGEADDRVKAARERGLLLVRGYQTQINNNPALKAILVNPFARVPLTDLHKCLGDLDLNLQRCLQK